MKHVSTGEQTFCVHSYSQLNCKNLKYKRNTASSVISQGVSHMRTVSPSTFLSLFHFSLFVLPSFSGSIRFTLMLPPVRQGNPNVYSWSGTTPPQLSSLSPSLSSPSSTQWQPSLRTVSYWRSTVRTTRGPRS